MLELTIAKTVAAQLKDPKGEIALEQARAYDLEAKVGDVMHIPLEVEGFGRIAAQTAKQVIIQKVREAAMRTQSINNLKNIALSVHGFHDVNKSMPFNGSDKAVGNVKYPKAAKANTFTSGSRSS